MTVATAPRGLAFWIATGGGLGLLKPVPGTWGSAGALVLGWFIVEAGGTVALAIAALLATLAGVWAADRLAKQTGISDPSEVVIDEVAGQWIALLLVPHQWPWFLAAFALFRLFDIAKPGPIGWVDRNIKGGAGVMLDDILAGAAATLLLWGLQPWIADVLA